MNNKVAINTYLSASESKRQTEKTRTETESWIWSVLMVAGWEGGKVEGIKKYKLLSTEQPWGCKRQYRKWRSQRTHMHDPWA